MEFNKDSFETGKAWFFESRICLARSFKIRENQFDIHGAIEALQHCFELSFKSLYIILDMPYPRDHDAARNIDKFSIKLFQTIPGVNQDAWPPIESWIKQNSKYLKKIHETSIYGDEENGILASKLFSSEDLGNLTQTVSALWSYAYHTLAIIGIQNKALTQDELDDYQIYVELSKNAKTMSVRQKEIYFNKIFDSKKMRY